MPLNFQQGSSPASQRLVLAVLLVVSIVLVGVYSHEGDAGVLHGIQNAVAASTTPAQRAGAGVGAATESLGDLATDATADASTMSALKEQNEQLRAMLADAEEYRLEAERLQSLLNMEQTSGVTGVSAQVVGKSADAWNQTVTVDAGTADGVETGMTVMGSTGVIGQISHADEHSSTVRLLTDPNSGAAVMIQSSRANGIVRGSLDGTLYLQDIDEDEIPAVGDVVITSGLGGSYTAGLIVGTVVSVNKTASNSTGTIIVEPNDQVRSLEDVIIVTGKSTTQSTSATTSQSASASSSATASSAQSASTSASSSSSSAARSQSSSASSTSSSSAATATSTTR